MARANGKPLRFAALIRVSTEKQAAKGESLRTQAKQIEQAVASLGGKIVARYGGQEHATEGWEKQQLDRLLSDAAKTRRDFDAVMVADASRWSRDNAKSKAGLRTLRDSGVKFFTLTQEHDLFDPNAILFLGMSAEFGEFQARTQKKKAIENRIERAKRGYPTAGSLPFGRDFDKTTGTWSIIPEKRAVMVEIADRYVEGESLQKLADEFGLNYSRLWENLREFSGEKWQIRFQSPDLNIDETIPFHVPRLLPEKTIRAVKRRLEENRRFRNRAAKHEYLLSGHIFCAACGYMMTGAAKPDGTRYYRHNFRQGNGCSIRPRPSVRADVIEAAVIADVFDMLGNPSAIERAVKATIPDHDRAVGRRERLTAELAKIDKARDRIIGMIEKDAITDEQAESKLLELRRRETELRAQLETVQTMLSEVPDTEAIRLWVHRIAVDGGEDIVIQDEDGNTYAGGNDVASYLDMTGSDNRSDRAALIRAAFAEPMPDGTPAGVYITPAGGSYGGRKRHRYTLRGRLFPKRSRATAFASSDRSR